MKKKIMAAIATLSILVCLMTTSASAAYVETVRSQWDRTWSLVTNNEKEVNVIYRNITFNNGYRFTTTSKDITSATDYMILRTVTRYYRTYTTY